MARLRMSHVGVCVSDWQRSLRFYRDLLGFRPLRELRLEGEPSATLLQLHGVRFRAIYLEREGTVIELLAYETPATLGDAVPRPMNRLGLTHLSLQVDDLGAFLEELGAADVTILGPSRIDAPDGRPRAVFVTDPDGTRIELVQEGRGPGA